MTLRTALTAQAVWNTLRCHLEEQRYFSATQSMIIQQINPADCDLYSGHINSGKIVKRNSNTLE